MLSPRFAEKIRSSNTSTAATVEPSCNNIHLKQSYLVLSDRYSGLTTCAWASSRISLLNTPMKERVAVNKGLELLSNLKYHLQGFYSVGEVSQGDRMNYVIVKIRFSCIIRWTGWMGNALVIITNSED